METFSSEIGKKMRSAVKAKLIELGTEGGTSGYVDDELPDYVMIMVANKRSKQQMTSDLTLFLGNKTELFVTWLHEVLQKLQEVTIPAPTAKKRKSGGLKEEVSSKKDKKAIRKEKKPLKRSTEQASTEKNTSSTTVTTTTTTTQNTAIILPPTGNITDAFAEELLVKAKHNSEVEANAASHIKKGKAKGSSELETKNQQSTTKQDNEFDIPTISEISSTTDNTTTDPSVNREKDLAELAEIQKKIYAAKKHLKELGELKNVESEDEDFLRLRDEGSSDELCSEINSGENSSKQETLKPFTKEKSPIVFDKEKFNNVEESTTPPSKKGNLSQPLYSAAVKTVRTNSSDRQTLNTNTNNNNNKGYNREPRRYESQPQRSRDRERSSRSPYNRRPIHERLGTKPQGSESRPTRREKEIYVPAHRRQEIRNEKDSRPERRRSRSRDRDDRRNERERFTKSHERERERSESCNVSTALRSESNKELSKNEEDTDSSRETTRHRVDSRVIVASVKPAIDSSDEEVTDKPVNSVIKIKPRPAVSPSRQACKNLLLRAVAEAQRSTILSTTKPKTEDPKKIQVKSRLGKAVSDDHEELFTKTLRERRLKRSASNIGASTLFRRQTQNFIIKVDGGLQRKRLRANSHSPTHSNNGENESDEAIDTTLKVSLSPHIKTMSYNDEEFESYNSDEVDNDENDGEIELEKTQFVVTLNDDKATEKFRRRSIIKNSRSTSPPPQVTSSSSLARNYSNEPSSTSHFNRSRPRESRRSDIRSRLSKRPATPLSPSRATRLKERESTNSSPSSVNTPPRPPARGSGGYIETYRKAKDVKKIIIKNDSDDEKSSSPVKQTPEKERLKSFERSKERSTEKRSRTPSLSSVRDLKSPVDEKPSTPPRISPLPIKKESKHIPIKFDLDIDRTKHNMESSSDRDMRVQKSNSRERSVERPNGDDKRRVLKINNKYDNIPALSSIALDSTTIRVIKPKERCKYHPNCTKQFCDYYHPTAPCKIFPNCKYADKCMYSHPKCKYDMACTNIDCNFSHSGQRNPSQLQPTAPPLSSHVVPVQNYKKISATAGASSTMCKYYPNCTKVGCTFYHPKACRFGKNCINKLECNFYHHELQSSSKFKWVASAT